jgi:hypothetical protein
VQDYLSNPWLDRSIVRIFHRFKTTSRNTQNYISVVHESRSSHATLVTTPHVHASYTAEQNVTSVTTMMVCKKAVVAYFSVLLHSSEDNGNKITVYQDNR